MIVGLLSAAKYEFEYSSGKINIMVEVFSRNHIVASVHTIEGLVLECIKEGLQYDEQTQTFIELADKRKMKWLCLENGSLYAKGQRIYVPNWGHLRRDIIKDYHDKRYAGQPETYHTLSLVSKR